MLFSLGSVVLQEGDVVVFGHQKGQKLKPGTWVRQPDSEYMFIVRQVSLNKLVNNTNLCMYDLICINYAL